MKYYYSRALISLLVPLLQIFVQPTAQAQPLKVPYVSLSPTAGPLWIAYDTGLFKKNNLTVELLYIPGGSVIIQSIMSGDVKVANMAPPSAIGAWAKGADLALIASGVDQLLETVVTGPNIKRPADLKDKKIGVSRYGSLTDMALREALRHYKLVPDKDVTILQTGGEATRFAALTSGAIDGAMLSGDKKVLAEKMGFHVTIDLSELPIYYPVNGVIAAKKYLASQPRLGAQLSAQLGRGHQNFQDRQRTLVKNPGKVPKNQRPRHSGKKLRDLSAGLQKIPHRRSARGEVRLGANGQRSSRRKQTQRR